MKVFLALFLCMWSVSGLDIPPNPYLGEIIYDIYRTPANDSKERTVRCDNECFRPKSGNVYISEKEKIVRIDIHENGVYVFEFSFYKENKHYVIVKYNVQVKCMYDSNLDPNVWEHKYFDEAKFSSYEIADDILTEKWTQTNMPLFCKPPQIVLVDGFTRELVRVGDADGSLYFDFQNKRSLTDYKVFDLPKGMKCTPSPSKGIKKRLLR